MIAESNMPVKISSPEAIVNVLLVDDDESSQLLIAHMLAKVPGKKFKTETASTYEAGLEKIRRKEHDVYLLDYRLGARTGLDLLKESQTFGLSAPMILLTAAADPRVDQEATRVGAADFLLKDKLDSITLERSIRYSLSHFSTLHALQKSNERFRLLFERSRDAILISDDAGRFLEVNGAASSLLGYPPQALLTMQLKDFLPPDFGKGFKLIATEDLKGELYFNLQNGEKRFVEFSSSEFAPGLNLSILRDITDRRNLEQAIQEASEKEQRRLGQDLHDGLGQTLTGIGCLAKVLQQKLANKKSSEAADADVIAKLITQALSQTREMARGLCPVALDQNDLQAALKQLAGNLETFFRITSNLQCDSRLKIKDIAVCTHLYRIAQEAATNAIKHGKALHVEIRLGRQHGQIVLQIEDNGEGFPDGKIKSNGMGLRVMEHRARMIGGVLNVQRGKTGGTVVRCVIENTAAKKQNEIPRAARALAPLAR